MYNLIVPMRVQKLKNSRQRLLLKRYKADQIAAEALPKGL